MDLFSGGGHEPLETWEEECLCFQLRGRRDQCGQDQCGQEAEDSSAGWGFSNVSSGVSKGSQGLGTQGVNELGPCELGKRFLMVSLTAVPQSNVVYPASYRTEYSFGIYKQNLPRAQGLYSCEADLWGPTGTA